MRKRKVNWVKLIGIIVVIVAAVISYYYADPGGNLRGTQGPVTTEDHYMEFIDCGQGDCTLIVSKGEVTLVDATTGEEEQKVVDHLKSRGIKTIHHFVLTHPHEDHIGGAVAVLSNFEVEKIYMKKPTAGTEPTTSVYLNLLKKIKSQNKKITLVDVDDTFNCGSFTFTVLGPVEDYEDLNDQSIVLRGVFDRISVLLTGDQESQSEKDMVSVYGDALRSTILKVGHHGSSGSSTKKYLNAVMPQIAVISCGEGNSYGHPHKEAMERLNNINAEIYRTDTQGTITLLTDGRHVEYGETK